MKHRHFRSAFALLAGLLAGCTSYVKPLPPDAAAQPAKVPDLSGRAPAMTILSSLTYAIPLGANLGEVTFGWGNHCTEARPITYRNSDVKSSTAMFDPVFKDVMDAAGVPVQQTIQRFEGEDIKKADLQVAATIVDEVLNICYPQLDQDKAYARGESFVKVEWSVFSPLERTVIYTVTTTGKTQGKVDTRLGEPGVVREAFRDALGRLVALPAFGDLVAQKRNAPSKSADTFLMQQPPASTSSIESTLDALRRGIVTIRSNAGEGSGFAIGDGSYVVTAAHVVSGDVQVKLLGPGTEVHYADVIKVNPGRDLALLKVRTDKLRALYLAKATVVEGREAYAVGSPLGAKFAFSVTKGVISGLRHIDNRDYIQSDVQTLPGSSGGPLMDSNGNVIGVTVSGVDFNGAPVGMNFFVPAGDVAGALSIELK